ncbi:MAG TPA: hypothetical protein VLC49_16640 [Solirubrobacteraceae bacterium]|nr:hypothetical protein [Solirubrobacteraceae bacterium]
MPVLALVVVILALASGAGAILLALHRRRTPRELRGDWWTPFEREFRAYAGQAARQRRRHRGGLA